MKKVVLDALKNGIKNDPMTTITAGAPRFFFKGSAHELTLPELLKRKSIDPEKYKLPEKLHRSVAVTMLGRSFPGTMMYNIFKTLVEEVLGHKKK